MSVSTLILTCNDIDLMPGEHKTHFLNPNAIRLNKSLGDAVGLKNIGVHLVQVEPGNEATEYHIHYYEEECFYVLSGQGLLLIDEQSHVLNQGDFVGLPANTAAHNVINSGTCVLVLLVMGQRLLQDVADYPHKGKRLYRNSGEWNLVDMTQIINPKA